MNKENNTISFDVPTKSILAVRFACSKEPGREYLTGINLSHKPKGSYCVATNGHILMLMKLAEPLPDDCSYILPKDVIKFIEYADKLTKLPLDKPNTAHFTVTGNKFAVNVGQYNYSGSFIDAKYPDWRRVVPAEKQQLNLNMPVGINVQYLIDFYKSVRVICKTSTVCLSCDIKDASAPILIRNSHPDSADWRGVLMPMRI